MVTGDAAVMVRERPDRHTMDEPCLLTREDGASVSATLRNLSEGGFCIHSPSELRAGEMIRLRVLGVNVAGTIRWVRAGLSGGSIEL